MEQLSKIFNKSQLLLLFFIFIMCGKEPLQRNPYLVDIRFQRDLNLSLPLYNGLNYVGGSMLIPDLGINGVIIFNLNNSSYLAWEATCPNHTPKGCSSLSIEGVLAVCSCEEYKYSLATGQILNPNENLNPPQNLLFYQIQNLNGTLRVFN